MNQKIIIMSVTIFITQLTCQLAPAQENVVLQDNEITGLIIDRPVRMGLWPTGVFDAQGRLMRVVEMEGVEQYATIQGIKALILYAEFANTNEAHRAVEFYSKSHQTVFYPGLWDGAQTNSIGDELWYGENISRALLFRSGRICVLVSCDGLDVAKQKQVAELLAKPIEDKIERGGRVILTYEDGYMLPAQVRLKPESLEVSPGILTAFVRLPEGYPVTNITSATCDGARPERMMVSDDGTEMIMKFRRKDIEETLAKWGGILDTHFVIRGEWRGSLEDRDFHGVASIKKIVGAEEKKK